MKGTMKLYDALTQTKKPLVPLVAGKITLYVCGVTVYDHCHLGHGRVFVVFDTLYRLLRHEGYEVRYVRNITDIDDKIIARAQERNEDMKQLTERYIQAMHEVQEAMNVLPPTVEPRASQSVAGMCEMIQSLCDQKHAYVQPSGDVLFSVRSFASYGALSHRHLEDMQPGARVVVDEHKHDPLDFVLWKAAKPEEPHYPSPWGVGRPGWHIECSAMAKEHLGSSIDIHGGGQDLLFPHHENERAQTEAACGGTFVNHWMHVGFVQNRSEKMSKSLNNFFTLQDLYKEHHPEVLRHFLLSTHYRSPVNVTPEALTQAQETLTKWYRVLDRCGIADTQKATVPATLVSYQERFEQAMRDDLNVPQAHAVLSELVGLSQQASNKGADRQARDAAEALAALARLLGVLHDTPEQFLRGQVDPELQVALKARDEARAKKDWATADALRATWLARGILLEDGPSGTQWRKA